MNTFKARLLSILVLVCLLSVLPGSYVQARGTIIRVKWDTPGPIHDGSSWARAYTDLREALAVSREGTQIWVARGTYKPTTGSDRNISFELQDGSGMYGGFVGNETMRDQRDPVANVTILSGDIGVPGNAGDNSYHVLKEKSYGPPLEFAELDGFTVTGGNANGDGNKSGGGLHLFYTPEAKIELRNMIFSENSAAWDGGGISSDSHQILLEDVTFINNKAAGNGGGLAFGGGTDQSLDLRNVTFTNNTAYQSGGGAYFNAPATLSSVTFTGNKATQFGGGLWFSDSQGGSLSARYTTFSRNVAQIGGGMFTSDGIVILDRVTFLGNKAITEAGSGGGLFSKGDNITLDEVTFKSNTAILEGGGLYNIGNMTITRSAFYANITSSTNLGGGAGIYNNVYYINGSPVSGILTVINSTFYKNATNGAGGGINNHGTATISYSTFSENSALQDGAGVRNSSDASMELNNSILANSTSGADCTNYGGLADSHNLIETHDGWGCGSPLLTSDPNLDVLRDNGGYTITMALLPGSPAIDAGDDAVCPSRDQRGAGRPEGNHCDLGAYEAPVVGPGTYDDTDANWTYNEFIATTTTGPYLETFHYSTVVGGYAEFLFTGSQITLLYSKYSNRGNLEVYVDGVLVDTIDQYNSTRIWQAEWTSEDLGAGGHTVRLVHAGPSGSRVDVDAIIVHGVP